MKSTELIDRIASGTLSRRGFNRALAGAGLAVATLPLLPRAASAAGKVLYYSWSGYEEDALHADFSAKYPEGFDFSPFGDEEEALTKMRAGYKPTLGHPCTYAVPRWRDAGVTKPIDVSRLQHYETMWPQLKALEVAHSGGEVWFIPFDWGNSSVLYRTDLVDEAYGREHSWKILFDERYKGRLATYDSVDGAVITAAMVAGVADPFRMTDAEIELTREVMRKQQPLMRFYWADQSSAEQALASGEVVASYAWNSSALNLKQEGVPVEYMNPKEGILCWVCGLMLIKDGPGDEQAAYDFIDAMLTPEVGKHVIENWGYGHSNAKAFDLVDKEVLAERGISTPTALFEQGVFFEEIPPATRDKLAKMFEEVKAGF